MKGLSIQDNPEPDRNLFGEKFGIKHLRVVITFLLHKALKKTLRFKDRIT